MFSSVSQILEVVRCHSAFASYCLRVWIFFRNELWIDTSAGRRAGEPEGRVRCLESQRCGTG